MNYAQHGYVVGKLTSGDYTVKTIDQLRSCGGNFGGIIWKNITVQEMVRFYGVMIRMIIDPCHLGGYEGYFTSTLYVRVGCGYNVKLVEYGGWEERIINPA